jgi:CO/xanthine dehydrogenase FAD-binding subunit
VVTRSASATNLFHLDRLAINRSRGRSVTSSSISLNSFDIRDVIGKYFQTRGRHTRAQCLRTPTIGSKHAPIGFSDKRDKGGDFDSRRGASHTRARLAKLRDRALIDCEPMKPAPFKYVAAASLEHALALKAEYGDEARFLAGGQSLIPTMNFRLARPAVLIDLNRIDGLGAIRPRNGGGVCVGALTRYRTLERDLAFARMFPLIAEALPHIAHPQIRNRGTIGGNLSHADPASEIPAIAVALGARFRIQGAKRERWCEASDFFLGALTTDLQPDEMLVEIELPLSKPRTGSCFLEVARRRGDFAVAGLAVTITLGREDECESVRLALCGVGETPVDASSAADLLKGYALNEEAIHEVAASVEKMIDPSGSVHATADYQRHIAGVLTGRALKAAYQRARDGH